MRYQEGGWQSIPPPLELSKGCIPPEIFTTSLLRRLLTWNRICDHRQVGQAGKNGDAPAEACLEILENSFFYYRKLEELGAYFFIFFFIMNKNSLLLVAF